MSVPTELPPQRRYQVELAGWVRATAAPGDWVACLWEVANLDPTVMFASFYLHCPSLPLVALSCSAGSARRGRFHGGAALVIRGDGTATVWALVEASRPGSHAVRAAIVTRDETIERTDVVVVAGSRAGSRAPSGTAHVAAKARSARPEPPGGAGEVPPRAGSRGYPRTCGGWRQSETGLALTSRL